MRLLILLLLSACGATGSTNKEPARKFTFLVAGQSVSVRCGDRWTNDCGVFLADCEDGNKYQCLLNLKVEQ